MPQSLSISGGPIPESRPQAVLITHPLEQQASQLAGVSIASWAAVREDTREYENTLDSGEAFADLENHPCPLWLLEDPIEDQGITPQQPILASHPCEPMVVSGIRPVDVERKKLVEKLEGGFHGLAHFLFARIENQQNTIAGIHRTQALKACWRVLLSTDARVLRCLLEGNLVKEYKTHKEVQVSLQRLRLRARQACQPCIYGNFFTTKGGDSPTAAEVIMILDSIETYANIGHASSDHQRFALKVDTINQSLHPTAKKWTSAMTQAGCRKYLAVNPYVSRPEQAYLDSVTSFVRVVRQRLHQLPAQALNEPFEPCLSEIGYTAKSEARLSDHRTHRSSNRLMNLFEAVSMVLFGDKYRIQQFVLYLIWHADQASVAEIIFTMLSNAFVGGGCGFSFCNPGISVASANRVNAERWQDFVDWAADMSPYLENDRLEMIRLTRRKERYERVQRKIEDAKRDFALLEDMEDAEDDYEIDEATQSSSLEELAKILPHCTLLNENAREYWHKAT